MRSKLSLEWLAEIQRLCNAATPGPWEFDTRNNWIDAEGLPAAVAYDVQCEADGAFIAAARTVLPELLAAYREVAALLKMPQEPGQCNGPGK